VFVRPAVEHENVSALAREGLTSSEIARLTGIPRTTVRSWLALGSTEREKRKQRRRRWAANWADLPAAEYACDHLDLMGVRWRRIANKSISVARMADVAVLDSFIGPKR
jgi:orotate phosphoribosyltransferase-like protein